MKEECKVSCGKVIGWLIVVQEDTNTHIFSIFKHGAEYGAEWSAESGAKQSLSEILTIGKLPTLREQGLNLQQYVKKFLNYENVHYVNEMTQQNCRGPYVTFLEDFLFKRHL